MTDADASDATPFHDATVIDHPDEAVPEGALLPLLFWDIETTGFYSNVICQIAYVIVEDDGQGGTTTTTYDELLRLPDGVLIDPSAHAVHGDTALAHSQSFPTPSPHRSHMRPSRYRLVGVGISEEDCMTRGIDAIAALVQFEAQVSRIRLAGGRVVAHNSAQDERSVRNTFQIWDAEAQMTGSCINGFCTKSRSTHFSPYKDKIGRPKGMKLGTEWYPHHFGALPTWAHLHNAMDDVRVLMRCYFAAQRQGWWEARRGKRRR